MIEIKDAFNKNVLILLKGTTIAQSIPILITPILTRLYTPDDFGVFSLFAALVSIIGAVVCMRYELAILLPKEEKDSIELVFLSLLINSFISCILLLIILFFNKNIAEILKEPRISLWLYFVPIAVFSFGIFNSLNSFNTRSGDFVKISNASIKKSLVLAATQLSLGLFKGPAGLVLGNVNSNVFANYALGTKVIEVLYIKREIPNQERLMILAKRYIDFPKYSMPSALANSSGIYLINILISTYFSITSLGFYAFSQKLLGIPSMLIGNSISQVFVKSAVEEKNLSGSCEKTYAKTFKRLCFISIPVFLILYFIVEDLFSLIFGSDWLIAGSFSKILIPMFCVRFISSPLSMVTTVYQKQKISLTFQIIFLAISISSILFASWYSWNISQFLTLYTILLSFFYPIKIFIGYLIAKKSNKNG
jgi:O-antigen/teichoic acid export membrane protein